jgi:hypothetical protein
LNRTKTCIICFAAACFFLTANAFAGITKVVGGALSYATQAGGPGAVFTVPAQTVTRDMGVIRGSSADFFLTVTLGGGAQFAAPTLPTAGNLTLTTPAGGAVTISLLDGGANTDTSVKFFVDITTGFTSLPTLTLTTTGWTIRDTTNTLGTGGTITITVGTSAASTDNPIDVGTDTVNWLTGVNGVGDPTLTPTTAVIDVLSTRLNFTATAPDTSTQDNGATLAFASGPPVLGRDGNAFVLGGPSSPSDSLVLVLVGNLDGVLFFTWNPEGGGGGSSVTHTVTPEEVAAGSATLLVTGAANLGTLGGGARGLQITVTGYTPLTSRTLRLSVAVSTAGGTQVLIPGGIVTTWTLNGTILVANWVNGNSNSLSSRIYVWNPSGSTASVTARLFAMPVASTGSSTLLGTRSLGTLLPVSGWNIRLKEDVLVPLNIPVPYSENGGNLVLEVTIDALGCSGYTQTFGSTLAYGTTPLTSVK